MFERIEATVTLFLFKDKLGVHMGNLFSQNFIKKDGKYPRKW